MDKKRLTKYLIITFCTPVWWQRRTWLARYYVADSGEESFCTFSNIDRWNCMDHLAYSALVHRRQFTSEHVIYLVRSLRIGTQLLVIYGL